MYGFGFNTILFSCAICWAFIVINDQMIPTVSAATVKPTKTKVRSSSSSSIIIIIIFPTLWRVALLRWIVTDIEWFCVCTENYIHKSRAWCEQGPLKNGCGAEKSHKWHACCGCRCCNIPGFGWTAFRKSRRNNSPKQMKFRRYSLDSHFSFGFCFFGRHLGKHYRFETNVKDGLSTAD